MAASSLEDGGGIALKRLGKGAVLTVMLKASKVENEGGIMVVSVIAFEGGCERRFHDDLRVQFGGWQCYRGVWSESRGGGGWRRLSWRYGEDAWWLGRCLVNLGGCLRFRGARLMLLEA